MSAAAAVRLVAAREVRERGRSKVFWVGTSVLLAGVVAAIVVPAMLGHYRQQTFRVGTVGAAPPGLTSSVIADAAALEHAGPGRVRVTFHDADPQAVLDRARAAGTVRRFAIEEPSLSELFLRAVRP